MHTHTHTHTDTDTDTDTHTHTQPDRLQMPIGECGQVSKDFSREPIPHQNLCSYQETSGKSRFYLHDR